MSRTFFSLAPLASVLALTVAPGLASAAIWPADNDARNWHAVDRGLPWKNGDVSYVDDGLRAPLGNMRSRLVGEPPAAAPGQPAHASKATPGTNRRQSAGWDVASQSGGMPGGVSGQGLRQQANPAFDGLTENGVFAPPAGGLGTDSTTGPDLISNLAGPGNGVSETSGISAGEEPSAASLQVVPLPAGALLLLTGLGGLVPLLFGRRNPRA